jgi:hypothetical protein
VWDVKHGTWYLHSDRRRGGQIRQANRNSQAKGDGNSPETQSWRTKAFQAESLEEALTAAEGYMRTIIAAYTTSGTRMEDPDLDKILNKLQLTFLWDERTNFWGLTGPTRSSRIWHSGFFSAPDERVARSAAVDYIRREFNGNGYG